MICSGHALAGASAARRSFGLGVSRGDVARSLSAPSAECAAGLIASIALAASPSLLQGQSLPRPPDTPRPHEANARSLAEECTPLKKRYDACFNLWFEGYLQPALDAAAQAQRGAFPSLTDGSEDSGAASAAAGKTESQREEREEPKAAKVSWSSGERSEPEGV